MIRPSIHLHFLCIVAVTLGSVAPAAVAQDLDFERVLVPISVGRVPGAHGTLWSTELWYRNDGDVPVAMFPLAISDFVPTIGRSEFLPIGNFPPEAPGQILFISRTGGARVQFDLRLFNLAEPRGSWGTKIPVVRERQFADAISLINVPTASAFRCALRIYGLPAGPLRTATVRVRIYSNDERLLSSREMLIAGWPLYGQVLSLADAFPEIRHVDRVRVEVESADSQVEIWAFVAVVSNDTQSVALVTPD